MTGSVRLSVRLSVRPSVTPFSPCSHHRIIMKFSGVITNDKGDVRAKGPGQRSKVKVTEVNTQLNRFRTVTLVWIHIWWWNDAYEQFSSKASLQIWCWHPLHFANTNSKGTKIASSCAIPHKEIIRHNTIFQLLFFFSIFRVYIAKFLPFLIKSHVRLCHMMSSRKKYNSFYSIQATYVVSLSNTSTSNSCLYENIYLTRTVSYIKFEIKKNLAGVTISTKE